MALGEGPEGEPVSETKKAEAFEALIERHYRSVASVAYAALGSSSELEDVLQASFFAAFRSLRNLEDRSKFRFWLRAIAANQSRDLVRRQAVFGVQDSIDDLITVPEQETAEIVEASWVLDEICEHLPKRYSQVLYLRYYLGYTVSEVAEALGIDSGLVKWRASRARQLATRLLRGEDPRPNRTSRSSEKQVEHS